MKRIFVGILLCSMAFYAQALKINVKAEIRPFTIKIEKSQTTDSVIYIFGTIKQIKPFSYNVSFENCQVISLVESKVVSGELVEWNSIRKIITKIKTISDKTEEKFILAFPTKAIPVSETVNLKIGTIQNSKKTPLIIEGVTIR